MDFYARYIDQRNAAFAAWGRAAGDGSYPNPNITGAAAQEYADGWSAAAAAVLVLQGDDVQVAFEQLSSQKARFDEAMQSLPTGTDGMLTDPNAFWQQLGSLALTLDGIQGVPSTIVLGLKVLGGTVADTVSETYHVARDAFDLVGSLTAFAVRNPLLVVAIAAFVLFRRNA